MTDGTPITGTASTVDGAVTVEAGIGGGLRAVRLTRAALHLGGPRLAATILEVAARATALANQRAGIALRRTLGASDDVRTAKAELSHSILAGLGLSVPDDLAPVDEDFGERGVMRR